MEALEKALAEERKARAEADERANAESLARAEADARSAASEDRVATLTDELAEQRFKTDIVLHAAVQGLIDSERYGDAYKFTLMYGRTLDVSLLLLAQVEKRWAHRHVHARGATGSHPRQQSAFVRELRRGRGL